MTTDCLTPAERTRLEALRRCDVFVRQTLEQVDRVVASRRFARVQQRAKDFLGYVVAKLLLGEADQIKETTVAMAVFGESADFNPLETSKVRVAGTDLRQRLAAYTQHEGQNDVIQILIPPNTYVPELSDRRIAVAITEFENWHPHADQRYLCAAITAEIAYQLGKAGLRAGPAAALWIGSNRRRYTLCGSVVIRKDRLRITVSLADPATGDVRCSQSFEGARDDVLKLTGEVVQAIRETLADVDDERRPAHVSI